MHSSLWIGWAFLACDAARAELIVPRTTIMATFLFGSLTGVYPQFNYDDDHYHGDDFYYNSDGNYITDDDFFDSDDDDYYYNGDDFYYNSDGNYITDDDFLNFDNDDYYYNGDDHYYNSDDNYTTDDDDASCSTDKECPEDRCCHPDSNKCGRTSEYCHDVDGEKQCCPTLPDGDYGDCYADSICEEAETPWYEHPGLIAAAL